MTPEDKFPELLAVAFGAVLFLAFAVMFLIAIAFVAALLFSVTCFGVMLILTVVRLRVLVRRIEDRGTRKRLTIVALRKHVQLFDLIPPLLNLPKALDQRHLVSAIEIGLQDNTDRGAFRRQLVHFAKVLPREQLDETLACLQSRCSQKMQIAALAQRVGSFVSDKSYANSVALACKLRLRADDDEVIDYVRGLFDSLSDEEYELVVQSTSGLTDTVNVRLFSSIAHDLCGALPLLELEESLALAVESINRLRAAGIQTRNFLPAVRLAAKLPSAEFRDTLRSLAETAMELDVVEPDRCCCRWKADEFLAAMHTTTSMTMTAWAENMFLLGGESKSGHALEVVSAVQERSSPQTFAANLREVCNCLHLLRNEGVETGQLVTSWIASAVTPNGSSPLHDRLSERSKLLLTCKRSNVVPSSEVDRSEQARATSRELDELLVNARALTTSGVTDYYVHVYREQGFTTREMCGFEEIVGFTVTVPQWLELVPVGAEPSVEKSNGHRTLVRIQREKELARRRKSNRKELLEMIFDPFLVMPALGLVVFVVWHVAN